MTVNEFVEAFLVGDGEGVSVQIKRLNDSLLEKDKLTLVTYTHTDGRIDFEPRTILLVDTSLGDITITGFNNPKLGKMRVLVKGPNKLIFNCSCISRKMGKDYAADKRVVEITCDNPGDANGVGEDMELKWITDSLQNTNLIIPVGDVEVIDATTSRVKVSMLGRSYWMKIEPILIGTLTTPTNLVVVDNNDGTTTLSWDAVTNAPGYKVSYSQDDVTYKVIAEDHQLTNIVHNADEGGTIYYTVMANGDGIDWAASESAKISFPYQLPALPKPVGTSVIDNGNGTATFSWGAVAGASSYTVGHDDDGVGFDIIAFTHATTSITHTGTEGVKNAYRVRANGDGINSNNSTYSDPVSVVITNASNPTNVRTSPISQSGVRILWDNPATPPSDYEVEYATNSADPLTYVTSSNTITGSTSTFHNVNGLTDASTYYFRLHSLDGPAGNRLWTSAWYVGYTMMAIPTTVQGNPDTSTKISLRWDVYTKTDAFTIRHKYLDKSVTPSVYTSWVYLTTAATGNTYEHTTQGAGVQPGTENLYQVRSNRKVPYSESFFGTAITVITPS